MIDEEKAKTIGDRIKQSKFFLSLYTDNYETDPVCALQIGIALMLDKPIFLLVPNDKKVSNHLEKVSSHIEYFDSDDVGGLESAIDKLMQNGIKQYESSKKE